MGQAVSGLLTELAPMPHFVSALVKEWLMRNRYCLL